MYLLLAGFGLFQYERLFFALMLLLKPFNIVMYRINYDTESYGNIINILEKESYLSASTLTRSKRTPTGFFFSKNAIGHIESPSAYNVNEFKITIITTLKYYQYLTQKDEVEFMSPPTEPVVTKSSDVVKVYQRHGIYSDFSYIYLKLSLKGLLPLPQQEPIVEDITSEFSNTNKLTVFISGIPCSGKSSIGYLLAKKIGAIYCHSFNPTDPGDTFSYLVSRIRRDDDLDKFVPIVVVLEEVDVILTKIHNGTLTLNDRVPTSVKDKSSWTAFLDDMFFYQNIIMVLTSNKSKEEIDELDPAYLRKGRIHQYHRMNTPIIM
jgi:hypothetical protein